MLQQLSLYTLPTSISIASFDAIFFVAAGVFGFTEREVILGVAAGGLSGLSVLVAALWQSAKTLRLTSPTEH